MADLPHDWYKDAVFYEVYVRAYYDSNGDGHGDIQGLIQKLDHIKDLGVDCIWILPHYPSPLKDDGYDIADYYGIHPDYGTLDDFQELVKAVHERGLRLIIDLVLNHTSDQHEWFQQARTSRDSPYRDYYVWSDSKERYQDARIIFLDTETSNWTWEENSQQYYWHRFYSSQPDLNYDHPEVEREMFKIVKFWLEMGVDGFRADAVPYLFEREGTNCENLPETHAFLKRLRKYMDDHFPGTVILSEANQWPEDVRPYFGDGDEVHMAFHFPIMPRIYMSLKQANRTSMVEILNLTPLIPDNCQWCVFLRNHDELTLEMVTEEERQWMWEQYAPDPRMRLNLGIRRRLAPLLDNDRRRIELVNSILFSLPGAPIIYYGDEIGMGDNIWLHDRSGVRTPMQWDDGKNAGFSSAPLETLYTPVIDTPEYNPTNVNVDQQMQDSSSLHHFTKKLIQLYKQFPFIGKGDFFWADLVEENLSIAAYWRTEDEESLLAVHNLSSQEHHVVISVPAKFEEQPRDLFTKKLFPFQADGTLDITMAPYQYLWLHF